MDMIQPWVAVLKTIWTDGVFVSTCVSTNSEAIRMFVEENADDYGN